MGQPRWGPDVIAWADRDFDREQASDGHSRYGHYVRENQYDLRLQCGTLKPLDPVRFAISAWETARPPVMQDPPFVKVRPDLRLLRLRNVDGRLTVWIKAELPHDALRRPVPPHWHDWPPYQKAAAPTDTPFLWVAADMEIPADDWELLVPQATSGPELVEEAIASVEQSVAMLNERVAPKIREVLGDGGW